MLSDRRGALDADDLIKIILVLVVIWLVLEILGEVVDVIGDILGPFSSIIGLIVVVAIVLWYFDYI